MSFDVISFAAGVTRTNFWGFLTATVVGAAPATFVYSFLGEQAPQYVNVLFIAFGAVVAAGIVAAIVRRGRRARRNRGRR